MAKDMSKVIFAQNIDGGTSGSYDQNKQVASDITKGPKPQTATNSQAPTQASTPQGSTSPQPYKESAMVTQAHLALQNQLNNAPGAYQSKWQAQIDEIMNAYRNREDFQYDLDSDALYQQYADQYARRGELAMMDTMGQAAAMTGGYGNSYAATAGNQAYQSYLQQLNDVIPELSAMAYDRYQQEGQDMLTEYSLLSEREDGDYAKYQDQLNRYYTDRDYLANRYDSERAYSQWREEFDFQKQQANKVSSGGGGGYGGDQVDTSEFSSDIKNKAASFTNNMDLAAYLDGVEATGSINAEQADALFAEFMTPEKAKLKDRTWTLKDGGGINWFGGIDNNAVVKDNYGNTYRLDKLKEALIAEGMGKDEAKDYIKKIQKQLGA